MDARTHAERHETLELARSLRARLERQRARRIASEELVLSQCDPRFLRTLTSSAPAPAATVRTSGVARWVAVAAGVALSVAAVSVVF